MAQVLVQNRVSLATPILPALVQQRGVSARKKLPRPAAIIDVTSPDGIRDDLYLSNYADIVLKKEFAAVPGAADLTFIGKSTDELRLYLDREKLAAYNLTTNDVVKALEANKFQVEAGLFDRNPPFPPLIPAREVTLTIRQDGLPDPIKNNEAIGNTAVKSNPNVLVRDVARIELTGDRRSFARYNGKPTVCMLVHPLPGFALRDFRTRLNATVEQQRPAAPQGLSFAVDFDFTPNWESATPPGDAEYLLLVDVTAPVSTSPERIEKILVHCTFESGPAGILRYNNDEAVEITANPAFGVALDRCRSLCIDEADAIRRELNLSDQYKLNILSE